MEQVLLDRLLDGDLSLFDQFYQETHRKVFYNILAILKDPVVAEDALQETYIRFLNNKENLKKEKNILGYLFVISRNISLDMIKKRNRETSISEYDLNSLHEEYNPSYQSEIFEIMKKILSDVELQVVVLHVLNDMTHKEISEILKKPLGTITWTYNNAIKKLRKGMKDYE